MPGSSGIDKMTFPNLAGPTLYPGVGWLVADLEGRKYKVTWAKGVLIKEHKKLGTSLQFTTRDFLNITNVF